MMRIEVMGTLGLYQNCATRQLRGVDVLTAQEDNTARLSDSELLDRASELERVLFSQDDDLLAEATIRQSKGQAEKPFAFPSLRHPLRLIVQHHELPGLQRALRIGFPLVVTELDLKDPVGEFLDHGADLALDKAPFGQIGQ